MCLILNGLRSLGEESTANRLADLPVWCFRAAGGQGEAIRPVATAWYLLYTAAHVLDTVEDGDPPDPWWAELSAPVAINAATGMLLCASLAMQELYQGSVPLSTARAVVPAFYRELVVMAGGQHEDLTNAAPSLEEWWRIAETKSGTFFALACRSGARLATDDEEILAGYERYGRELGVLLQILDDARDFRQLGGSESDPEKDMDWTLPLAYALEVLPPEEGEHLRGAIRRMDRETIMEVTEVCGASKYLSAEIERRRRMAAIALEAAHPQSPAGDHLFSLLEGLTS